MHVEVLIQQRVPLGRPIIVQLHKGRIVCTHVINRLYTTAKKHI